MRCSIGIARTAAPAYSTTWPRAPETPSSAMMRSATSLAVTCGPSVPSRRMRIDFGRFIAITCVARMCASSVVPQPKASAPSPPTVEAWLSGTACVAPGSTMPSSGATTCEMPCSGSPRSKTRMPFLRAAFAHGAQERRARRDWWCRAAGLGGDGVVLHREGEVGPPHRPLLLLAAARRRAARAARAARGGRCRSGRGRPCAAPPDGRPRSCRTGSWGMGAAFTSGATASGASTLNHLGRRHCGWQASKWPPDARFPRMRCRRRSTASLS